MRKVLITGGCGFIGSYVVERLHSVGINTVLLDRYLHDGQARNVFFGDVRDEGAVRQAMYGCDGFMHLAGVLGTQETVQDPTSAAEVNVFGSLNVFKAARDLGIPGVYIAVGNHWMNNPYSITKTTAERFAFMANKEWGAQIAVVRALNAYGPRQKSAPVRKLMPNLIKAALNGEAFPVYGNGHQVMDMIYVTDLAEIMFQALVAHHENYDTPFEAGSGIPTTVREICDVVYKAAGHDQAWLDHQPMRPGEIENSTVLGDPITLAPLGIVPRSFVSLEDGVKRTLEWYKQNG